MMFVGLNCSNTQLVTICVTVFLTNVRDCYVLIADGVIISINVFIVL